jgi:hypothetical protein
MRRLVLHSVVLTLAMMAGAQGAPLQCDVGPVTKVFGSVPWLVYSCIDSKSVVIVSAPGSPASPFYFMFSPEGTQYHLRGEGTGAKNVTDAALRELQALSAKDVQELINETKAVKSAGKERQ